MSTSHSKQLYQAEKEELKRQCLETKSGFPSLLTRFLSDNTTGPNRYADMHRGWSHLSDMATIGQPEYKIEEGALVRYIRHILTYAIDKGMITQREQADIIMKDIYKNLLNTINNELKQDNNVKPSTLLENAETNLLAKCQQNPVTYFLTNNIKAFSEHKEASAHFDYSRLMKKVETLHSLYDRPQLNEPVEKVLSLINRTALELKNHPINNDPSRLAHYLMVSKLLESACDSLIKGVKPEDILTKLVGELRGMKNETMGLGRRFFGSYGRFFGSFGRPSDPISDTLRTILKAEYPHYDKVREIRPKKGEAQSIVHELAKRKSISELKVESKPEHENESTVPKHRLK